MTTYLTIYLSTYRPTYLSPSVPPSLPASLPPYLPTYRIHTSLPYLPTYLPPALLLYLPTSTVTPCRLLDNTSGSSKSGAPPFFLVYTRTSASSSQMRASR